MAIDLNNLDSLVEEDKEKGNFRCKREIFTDEQLFELEMKHIFEGNWVYLAHESQLPNINDYYSTNIGRQPVFITRNKDGELNAFLHIGAEALLQRPQRRSVPSPRAVRCRTSAGRRSHWGPTVQWSLSPQMHQFTVLGKRTCSELLRKCHQATGLVRNELMERPRLPRHPRSNLHRIPTPREALVEQIRMEKGKDQATIKAYEAQPKAAAARELRKTAAASERLPTPSLTSTLDTWTLTVFGLMNSSLPISPLLRPVATRRSTSRSRGVSLTPSAADSSDRRSSTATPSLRATSPISASNGALPSSVAAP